MTESPFTPTQLAELHLIGGRIAQILKEFPVPPGHHRLTGRQTIFTCPPDASVVRALGRGDGIAEEPPPALKLTHGAMLLYIDRASHNPPTSPEENQELWRTCIRDDARGMTVEPPREATVALAQANEEQTDGEPVEVRTPAKRNGRGRSRSRSDGRRRKRGSSKRREDWNH